MTTIPSGVERSIARHELFFSTTDRRGIIHSGNSVFVRVSGYPLGELEGAPHSIVRHPEMPAGVFRLMWDRLLAGRPMAGYVQNLAKDGAHYWVFATITPLGDGFLSVRMPPGGPLFEAARDLYPWIRQAELAALKDGADRRVVAELGARLIEDRLRALGFAGFDDFMVEAMSTEIAARSRTTGLSCARPGATGPIAEVLSAAGALDVLLAEPVEGVEAHRALSRRLLETAAEALALARRVDSSVGAAQEASARVAHQAPVLHNVATVMAQPMHAATQALDTLVPRLRSLRADLAELRLRVALASLHTAMVAAFAAEVADGLAPPSSLDVVPQLCDVVHDGLVSMTRSVFEVNAELTDVAQLIGQAGDRIETFRHFLGQWRILLTRNRAAATALADALAPIDEEIDTGRDGVQALRALAQHCHAGTIRIDAPVLEAQLSRIRALTPSAAGSSSPSPSTSPLPGMV